MAQIRAERTSSSTYFDGVSFFSGTHLKRAESRESISGSSPYFRRKYSTVSIGSHNDSFNDNDSCHSGGSKDDYERVYENDRYKRVPL